MAWSYESLIAARVLQAMGGGAIQPIGMSIVAELFEPHERGKALGIWGMGIMAGPAIGPTLGGYLTDAYSWRTIFSVNLPVGVLTLLAGMIVMRPMRAQGTKRPSTFSATMLRQYARILGIQGGIITHQVSPWKTGYPVIRAGVPRDLPTFRHDYAMLGKVTFNSDEEQDAAGPDESSIPVRPHQPPRSRPALWQPHIPWIGRYIRQMILKSTLSGSFWPAVR